jgi:hypothetical protein
LGFSPHSHIEATALQWQEVVMGITRQAADFYNSGIQKLVPRINKCLDRAGDYVEK